MGRGDYRTERRRRLEAIASGLCPNCKKNPPAPGRQKCQACTDYQRERSAVAYRNRVARGLCALCFKVPAAGGRTTCQACAAKKQGIMKRMRAERAADGLCQQCGKAPALPGLKVCEKHRAEAVAQQGALQAGD